MTSAITDIFRTDLTDESRKMEVDYSTVCDEKIPLYKEMSTSGKFIEAIDGLLSLEKQARTGCDMVSTSRVLVAIVQICYEAKNWTALNEHISLLAKRRSQLKQAVVKMVQECCTYVDEITDEEIKLKLIDTLRTVTEGKIYVEVERARLTHKLALIKENKGDIAGAATIMQELQVETYGSMEKQEKVELILEQMRLTLAKKDYIRTQIISKKINVKYFEDENLSDHVQDLKLKYFRLMIELDEQESNYLSICKHYRAILVTPKIINNEEERKAVMKNVALYIVLASYDNEQSDLIHRILQDKHIQEVPVYKELLNLFVNPELIRWVGLCNTFEKDLKQGSSNLAPTKVFAAESEFGTKRWDDLKKRVVEHNIRVMAKYYNRITLARMSELLDLPPKEAEEFLSQMVTNQTVTAKTDRPAGIVNFGIRKDPSQVLNDWSENLSSLMKLVNNTTHLINKEQMLHKHLYCS